MPARGLRVLVADLDTQGHAGKSLGVDVRGLSPTIHDFLLGELPIEAVAVRTPVPGRRPPARQQGPGRRSPSRWRRRRTAPTACARRLDGIPAGAYDVVLMDAPPSVSLVTENVLRAGARGGACPSRSRTSRSTAAPRCSHSLDAIRASRGRAPALTLVVPTLYRKTQLADEILAKLRERFPAELSGTVLGWSVKIDEAQSHGRTIFEYAPRSTGARAIAAIADEIRARAPMA